MSATFAAGRVAFQVFRRDADGAYVLVESGAGPAFCRGIDAYIVAVREGATVRLRIARDGAGENLVPSLAERVRQLEDRLRTR